MADAITYEVRPTVAPSNVASSNQKQVFEKYATFTRAV